MMRPSRIHYILAHGFQIAPTGFALAFAGLVFWGCSPSRAAFGDLTVVGLTLLSVLLSLPLGWILGVLFLWPIVFHIGARIQGAPFREGDTVHILIGPHCDTVAQVYAVWTERNQVRVTLGDTEKERVTDVFSYVEVCREGKRTKP